MSESFWLKELTDGSVEVGTDTLIDQGKASWTRGRQDIESVVLSFVNKTVKVCYNPANCKPESWQLLDGFIYSSVRGSSSRVSREIRCKTDHLCAAWSRDPDGTFVCFLNDEAGEPNVNDADYLVCYIKIDGTVGCRWG